MAYLGGELRVSHIFSDMFNYLAKNKNGQTTVSEYVLVTFVIIASITTMMIYFKRAVQARIYDTRQAMLNIVATEAQGYYTGNIYIEYEPYYTNTDTTTWQESTANTEYYGVTYGEHIGKKFRDITNATTTSVTAPPKDAD